MIYYDTSDHPPFAALRRAKRVRGLDAIPAIKKISFRRFSPGEVLKVRVPLEGRASLDTAPFCLISPDHLHPPTGLDVVPLNICVPSTYLCRNMLYSLHQVRKCLPTIMIASFTFGTAAGG